MKATVAGIEVRRSGISKNTGKEYDGQTIYVLTPDKEVQGSKTEEIYFNYKSRNTYPEVNIGDEINVEYDKKGYIREITKVKAAKGA